MERVDQTLYDFLETERSPATLSREIIPKIDNLLRHLRHIRVVHRDLALFNIGMVFDLGGITLKLLDFGDSKEVVDVNEYNIDTIGIFLDIMTTMPSGMSEQISINVDIHVQNLIQNRRLLHEFGFLKSNLVSHGKGLVRSIENQRFSNIWNCLNRHYHKLISLHTHTT